MNLIGHKYNRLSVTGQAENYVSPTGGKMHRWVCKCDCGNEVTVTTSHLRSGHTKSCGCLAREKQSENGKKKKHGLTYDADGKCTRIYRIWSQMKTRCFNSKDDHFKDYGGRGISVCDEWKNDFKTFHDWALEKGYSDDLSIDRIDSNGNYEPSNCRWATSYEQTNNRRTTVILELDGERHTLSEWSKIKGIGYQTLFARYKSGKTPDEILKEQCELQSE